MNLWDWMFRRRRREEELDEEVQVHLRMAAQERMEQGESVEQARASAVREFGNVTLVKEVTRDMWGLHWLETLLQDVRYSLRMLAKNPGFTLVAVLTLALGIGANTAMFSVVNAVLLEPLPYQEPGRLVTLWLAKTAFGYSAPGTTTDPDYVQWRAQNRVFDGIAAFHGQTVNLTGGGEPERLLGAAVTPNLFPLLGVTPALGRTFLPQRGTDGPWERRAPKPSALGAAVWLKQGDRWEVHHPGRHQLWRGGSDAAQLQFPQPVQHLVASGALQRPRQRRGSDRGAFEAGSDAGARPQ